MLLNYQSYTKYLRDYHQREKLDKPSFSLEKYADVLGLNHSTLKMVLTGKRQLNFSQTLQVAKKLNFDDKESQYFDCLVRLESTDDGNAKAFLKKQMADIKRLSHHSRERIQDKDILSQWYIPPLIVYMLDTLKISETDEISEKNFKVMQKKFSITKAEIIACLKKMEELNILELGKGKRGYHLDYRRLSSAVSKKKYLRETVEKARLAVEQKWGNDGSYFKTAYLGISPEKIDNLVKEINFVLEEYIKEGAQGNDGKHKAEIMQVSLQVFKV